MKDRQWGFIFDQQSCIQCHACEVACKSWRNLATGLSYRRVLVVWDGQYPDTENRSLALSCMHCVDPACVPACPSQAIQKDPVTGQVEVEPDLCTGCRACLKACPFNVPQFGENSIMEKCDLCLDETGNGQIPPPCVLTCPTGALDLSQMTQDEKAKAESFVSVALQKVRP